VKSALEHALDQLGHRVKHTALEQDHEQQLFHWNKQDPESSMPVTRKEIKDYCMNQFQVPITGGWANPFVLGDPDEIIQAISSPREGQRLQAPRVFLERIVQNLKRTCSKVYSRTSFQSG
jgi:hypothetical protein